MTASGRASLDEVLDLAARAAVLGVHVGVPARVVAVKASRGLVRVQPQVRVRRTDRSAPAEDLPELVDVPVLFPSSAAAEITFALAAGDAGLLLFCDTAIGAYLQTGVVSDPPVDKPHGLAGAVFLPAGPWPEGEGPAIPSSGVVVGVRGGEALEVVGNQVRAGRGASEALAFNRDLEQLRNTIAGAVTGDAIPGAVGLLGPFNGTAVTKGK